MKGEKTGRSLMAPIDTLLDKVCNSSNTETYTSFFAEEDNPVACRGETM